MNRVGGYRTHTIAKRSYKSYIPISLPVQLSLEQLVSQMQRATTKLAELNGKGSKIPNLDLFLHMYVRKEAVLSSQIEGTQSSLGDLTLYENNGRPNVSEEDVKTVAKYVSALNYGIENINSPDGLPICLRLFRNLHDKLIRGTRGEKLHPGEFRNIQNWIGGDWPWDAKFVPPSPEDLMPALKNLEKYMQNLEVPLLLRTGVAHLQFETIHPFCDGNGRVGRLLIVLMLYEGKELKYPILYPSLFFKQQRQEYYNLLNQVRSDGNWEDWLNFFLEAIAVAAEDASLLIDKIDDLLLRCIDKIEKLGRIRITISKVFDLLALVPQIDASKVRELVNCDGKTARKALEVLKNSEILTEITQRKRGKIYLFKEYLDLLSQC